MQLLNRIYHQYGARLILEDVSLAAEPGQVVSLMGPSGCGKTTLLNLLAGLLSPTAGEVAVTATPIAYVFQEACLYPWYTTLENIALGLKAQGLNPRQQRQVAARLAATVGLADAANLYPPQLSGGMKQRVNLARAFAINPRLLLLDEPFSSLDIGVRQQLQQVVMSWVQVHQTVAIMVTHDLATAVTLGDRLLILSNRPARIIYGWQNERPPQQRDPAYVYHVLSELQAVPEVAASFGLETTVSLSRS
ncbi:MAG: ATP-binding cassette domain-containing protein [Leptolyngbya sp. SIO1E4]|nr:ATP-binding cassette domain-containing protein [Leptolyngbya sp. SIO1E4]